MCLPAVNRDASLSWGWSNALGVALTDDVLPRHPLPPASMAALFMGKYGAEAYENHFSLLSVWLGKSMRCCARAGASSALLRAARGRRQQQRAGSRGWTAAMSPPLGAHTCASCMRREDADVSQPGMLATSTMLSAARLLRQLQLAPKFPFSYPEWLRCAK